MPVKLLAWPFWVCQQDFFQQRRTPSKALSQIKGSCNGRLSWGQMWARIAPISQSALFLRDWRKLDEIFFIMSHLNSRFWKCTHQETLTNTVPTSVLSCTATVETSRLQSPVPKSESCAGESQWVPKQKESASTRGKDLWGWREEWQRWQGRWGCWNWLICITPMCEVV